MAHSSFKHVYFNDIAKSSLACTVFLAGVIHALLTLLSNPLYVIVMVVTWFLDFRFVVHNTFFIKIVDVGFQQAPVVGNLFNGKTSLIVI